MKKRVGKVTISHFFLSDGDTDSCKALSSVFTLWYVDTIANTLDHVFYGYCDGFDEIEEGDVIPEYKFTFRKINDLVLVSNIERTT